MNREDRDLIRRNYTDLANALRTQINEVVHRLFMDRIITESMKEKILEANPTKYEKAIALLDLIPSRGSRAFNALYEAACQENLYEVADILKKERGPHENIKVNPSAHQVPDSDSPDESLPDTWPSEPALTAYQHLRLIEDKHTKMMSLFKGTLTPQGKESTYPMFKKPRGRVLVINNELFQFMENRDGTFADRKALEKLFKDLGFDFKCVKDKTNEGLWKQLEEEANNAFHEKAQCFVLVILSHGHNGVVFGTDGKLNNGIPENCTEIQKITDLFSKSRHLQGKPKLFFIQACQGVLKNKGEPTMEENGSATSSSKMETDNAKKDSSQNSSKDEVQMTENAVKDSSQNSSNDGVQMSENAVKDSSQNSSRDGVQMTDNVSKDSIDAVQVTDAELETISHDTREILENIVPSTQSDAAGGKIPSGADVFVAIATVPGFLSWRNTKHGTWFIQAVAYVFAKYAYKYDLNKLMTMVNNLVGRGESNKGKYMQVGEKKDSFQRDFYFFPGRYEINEP